MKPNSVMAATAALATPTADWLKLCAASSQNATPSAEVTMVVPTIDPALASRARWDRARSRIRALRAVPRTAITAVLRPEVE